jgi:uncharacterized membrane protein
VSRNGGGADLLSLGSLRGLRARLSSIGGPGTLDGRLGAVTALLP